jgi:rhamnulokinase
VRIRSVISFGLKRYKTYVGVDLGAESGRVVAGDFDGDRLDIRVIHRFANRSVSLPDGLHWDVLGLLAETIHGLRGVREIAGLGVDAWGCDYALLDDRGRLLGLPFHYRDPRTVTVSERPVADVSREELFGRTGVQHLRFNTVYQLLADAEGGLPLERAARIALIPDLLTYWLTGTLVNEATIASSTSLADARTHDWAVDLVERLGLPPEPFQHRLTIPGTPVGEVLSVHGLGTKLTLTAVASHDTASAFAAAPVSSSGAAVISSGTWSVVGLEFDEPFLDVDAAAAGLGNEWGVDGTTRLLRNVAGLWLLQECRRQWAQHGSPVDYDELQLLAALAPDDVAVFDPDLDRFLEPGDMPSRIAAVCRETGQIPPARPAEFARSVLLSLVCKYRLVLESLEQVSGRSVEVIHIVGGGARNEVLCRLTADVLGVPVHAGPVEATAVGNILVQLRAVGHLASREEMRECVVRSFAPTVYEPAAGSSVYERFRSVTDVGDCVRVES